MIKNESIDLVIAQYTNNTWKECLRVLKFGSFIFVLSYPRQDVMSKVIVSLQNIGFKTGFTSIYYTSKFGVEVVIVAMKPLSEKSYIDQAMKNGKGISWFDDCRIPFIDEKDIGNPDRGKGYSLLSPEKGFNQNKLINNITIGEKGRFPANLLVSDDVLNDGKIKKTNPGVYHKRSTRQNIGAVNVFANKGTVVSLGDSGSFSRYFDLDKWWEEQIKKLPKSVQKTFPFLIVPKASKAEKNKGCDRLEGKFNATMGNGIGNREHNIEDERSYYKNNHPTVKPLKLFNYLITLGSRKNDIILDPFIGSGTTAIACKMLDREWIGIEREEEYCKIAQCRIKDITKINKLF
ncbi:hypothetical protein LCGC14_2159730 [marine sediment metagenome]|uniref:DNA methylase N-4/N-6 domain-containing protein n=1 Tax=marine sediment metagenome TaxID=412755 RepID=A0A0F9DT02_9ZZZZ